MNRSSLLSLVAAAAIGFTAVGVAALTRIAAPGPATYVTWDGIGPDKWASIWLIRRHLDPEARILRLQPGTEPAQGTAFDIPGAAYMRDRDLTTFDQLLKARLPEDAANAAALGRMAEMLNEMEVSRWTIVQSSQTGLMEQGYRDLQLRLGREAVPFACYMAFFDRVEAMLTRNEDGLLDDAITRMEGGLCDLSGETGATPRPLVTEMPVADVLAEIGRGKSVVFVDTREKAEYEEFHIPGAVHIPLREVEADSVAGIAEADLVIPYCVKDFRGYEVARAMAAHGVRNVAILNPYGIRGWRTASLPVTGSRGLSEPEGAAALSACARDPETCLD